MKGTALEDGRFQGGSGSLVTGTYIGLGRGAGEWRKGMEEDVALYVSCKGQVVFRDEGVEGGQADRKGQWDRSECKQVQTGGRCSKLGPRGSDQVHEVCLEKSSNFLYNKNGLHDADVT